MAKKIVLSSNAEEVAKSRYYNNGEDWEGCCRRVSEAVASVEKDKIGYAEKFGEMIYNMDFLPAGRILRNAGSHINASLLNCYVLPVDDSIESIGKLLSETLQLHSEGGGVGCNYSLLRPKGDPIMGKGGNSSGMVSFIKASDQVSKTIESGGQRRAASLACCDVSHPEIIDFINAKMVDKELSQVNISVLINEKFIRCVENDEIWTFKFNQKEYGKMPAKEIWDLIVKNMVKYAEPGILNSTNLFKNNSWYYDPVICTNPCGEAVLENYGSCCLGSLVLPSFITGNINTNWKKLENTIKLAIRFLDNVIDVNRYSLKDIEMKAKNSRRIGLGILGLAEYLFAKQLRYGSKEAIDEIEKLMRFIRDTAYETSIGLSVEKGSFPKFEPNMYGNSSFVRKLPAQLRMKIKNKGVRNVTVLSMAPTGTIALLTNNTGGIEPLFHKAYLRKDRISERIYIHPKYRDLILSGNSIPDWFVSSGDLSMRDHLETQSIIQHYTDGSCSKTINAPKGTTTTQVNDLLLEYIRDLKGITIYVDGAKSGQVYNSLTEEEVFDIIAKETIGVNNNVDISDVECNCQKSQDDTEDNGEQTCNIKNEEEVN